MSARKAPGEKKTVNEQLPLLEQNGLRISLYNLPHQFLLKDIFPVHN